MMVMMIMSSIMKRPRDDCYHGDYDDNYDECFDNGDVFMI
jgi:hypothetical protein